MRKIVHWIVAYIAVGLSAGLAAWSGVRGSDWTVADAAIKGLVMFVIAVLGCHGWAWAARLAKDGHKGYGVLAYLILSVSMVVTLLGGAGSFYGSANEKIASAERSSNAYARADAALKAIEAKRMVLTKHRSKGEIEPDITQAKADRRYKASLGCEPAEATASKTIDFCASFRALEKEHAATIQAERLDAEAEPFNAIVSRGRPAAGGGPGGILAVMFDVSQERGNALFSLLCTIALDMGALMALLTAELRGPHDMPAKPIGSADVPAITEIAGPVEPLRVPERLRPKLASTTRQPVGALLEFLNGGVDIVDRGRSEMTDAYLSYSTWCKSQGLRPMEVEDFFFGMQKLCRKLGIRILEQGDGHYLLNVQLKNVWVTA